MFHLSVQYRGMSAGVNGHLTGAKEYLNSVGDRPADTSSMAHIKGRRPSFGPGLGASSATQLAHGPISPAAMGHFGLHRHGGPEGLLDGPWTP